MFRSGVVCTIVLLTAGLIMGAFALNGLSAGAAAATGATGIANPETQEVLAPASPGQTHMVLQGTMWQPQTRGSFKVWTVYGWGVFAQRKPTKPMDQWVHIGVPLIPNHESTLRKVMFVEFCAKSTNGAVTKPTFMDLWDNDSLIGHYAISWPADNAYHCTSKTFSPAVWRSSLGISVNLHFTNPEDGITLYKAWASVTD